MYSCKRGRIYLHKELEGGDKDCDEIAKNYEKRNGDGLH